MAERYSVKPANSPSSDEDSHPHTHLVEVQVHSHDKVGTGSAKVKSASRPRRVVDESLFDEITSCPGPAEEQKSETNSPSPKRHRRHNSCPNSEVYRCMMHPNSEYWVEVQAAEAARPRSSYSDGDKPGSLNVTHAQRRLSSIFFSSSRYTASEANEPPQRLSIWQRIDQMFPLQYNREYLQRNVLIYLFWICCTCVLPAAVIILIAYHSDKGENVERIHYPVMEEE